MQRSGTPARLDDLHQVLEACVEAENPKLAIELLNYAESGEDCLMQKP